MSCPHAETTTLLWLYGELEDASQDAHLAHLADCVDCQAAIEAEESVAGALAGLEGTLPRLAPVTVEPANRPWLPWVAALAAALLLGFVGTQLGGQPEPHDTDLAVAHPVPTSNLVDLPLFGAVDAGLEDLDLELAELSFDMKSL